MISRKTRLLIFAIIPALILTIFSTNYYFHYQARQLIIEKQYGSLEFYNYRLNRMSQQKTPGYTKVEEADLDNDQINENCTLDSGRLTITSGGKTICKTPLSWWIDDFSLSDSTNDGVIDVNLSLWKAGSFGKSKPFWIKENDMSVKNHFFVYNYRYGSIKSIWCSSNLSQPNYAFKVADINNDSQNELIAVEGNYSDFNNLTGEYVAIWKWESWGFTNKWRSKKGVYKSLSINNIEGGMKIIVDGKILDYKL